MNGPNRSLSYVRTLLVVLLLALPGCVFVANENLLGVRLFMGPGRWPLPSGEFTSGTGEKIRIQQTISQSGERIYSVERDGSASFYALYARETQDWYILEAPGEDGSYFVFVKVFDGQAFAIFNDDDERCENYKAESYPELVTAMNARYFACPDVSEFWSLSGR